MPYGRMTKVKAGLVAPLKEQIKQTRTREKRPRLHTIFQKLRIIKEHYQCSQTLGLKTMISIGWVIHRETNGNDGTRLKVWSYG